MFKGSYTAIITPFNEDGTIDYKTYEKLVEFQIENGTDGIVPCRSTGESATMTHEEHRELIKFTIDKVNKRVAVIAGTGSNSTKEAVKLTKFAGEAGADGALVITPYYNKPTDDGLYVHFKEV
ncbi:MAG: dihydrodipicolinate synthase family protein, partial [Actinomycetia bacterium]|nr:dihydrodipicolinate synthase family protein [Actinomycetes bacterium]